MSRFPETPFDDAGKYVAAYGEEIAKAFATLDQAAFRKAAAALQDAVSRNATIFTCGNGGSAAIANHMVCDHTKGTRADTDILPRVHSLVANIEINTAIANDLAYDQVFSYQLQSYASKGDVLVAISSSGNSPNILNAIKWAKDHGVTTIAMTGFAGGKAKEMADIPLYVAANNYGVVEDVHQSLMHALAQFMRQRHMHDPALIAARSF
ncbi:MAG TPA: SIS domain-containing protein [Rhizomicrobium sp.]|nr:SIS domain-containing protein [Rhizomicrobium sp.]